MELPKLDTEGLGSPFADQLKRGFARLRFGGLLEKEFREFYVQQNLPRARLSGLIALILVLAVTCIDLVLGAATGAELNTLRLGVLVPLVAVVGIAISLPTARSYYTEVASVGVTLIGFVVTYIAHIAALQGASYVLAGLVLAILYACLFLGLLFDIAVGIAALLVITHFVMGIVLRLPLNELYYMTAILGAAACHRRNLDVQLRARAAHELPRDAASQRARRARRSDGALQPPDLRRLHRPRMAAVAPRGA